MLRSSLLLALCALAYAETPLHQAALIFPLEKVHNHSSSIVQLPSGDLFVCWYHGSGERTADDVLIEGARSKGDGQWKRMLLADTPGFPDTNPTLFVDSQKRVWLFWGLIVANEWHTALLKYRVATNPPDWQWQDVITLIPRNFFDRVKKDFEADLKRSGPYQERASHIIALASEKYFSRAGWFTRTHPIELPSGRIVVPLYSDGYSFGLMALSDDRGKTWFASEPITGYGGIQPSVVRRKNGDLVAYLRDNGPPPKRVQISISKDEGLTWTKAVDTDLPNSGSSVEAIALRDGRWAMAFNDSEQGRSTLALALSDDEGQTWKWKRHLENQPDGRFHYPSLIQAADGSLHITYTYTVPEGESIKHARVNTAWIEQGAQPQPRVARVQ